VSAARFLLFRTASFRYHCLMRRFALQMLRICCRDSAMIRLCRMRAPWIGAPWSGALCLCLLPLVAIATPAPAAELWRTVHARPIVYAPVEYVPFCYWCIRDAIYVNTKLIAHLEANPDVDEADKAPWIIAAHADVRQLRRLLGPVHTASVGPCCYWRKRLYVR
jgi:hypothetical protein